MVQVVVPRVPASAVAALVMIFAAFGTVFTLPSATNVLDLTAGPDALRENSLSNRPGARRGKAQPATRSSEESAGRGLGVSIQLHHLLGRG
jgi:hypothetical protein